MDTIEVLSPKGRPATLYYRDDTSDLSTIGSTWNLWGKLEDEYGLAGLPELSGTAVDVGAHIGSVALALLADHTELHVVAVEPLEDNVDVLIRSAKRNGWIDRLTVWSAGIATGTSAEIDFDFQGDDYIRKHRFIGGMAKGSEVPHQTVTVPGVSLSALLDGRDCEFLKHDCEGCEWALLDDPAIARCKRIVGEGHPADWLARVHAALDATHRVTVIDDRGGPGTYRAVLGHPTERDLEDETFARTRAAIERQHANQRPSWTWDDPR